MQEKKGSEKREVLLISFSISARFVFAIILLSKYTEEQLEHPTAEIETEIAAVRLRRKLEDFYSCSKRPVWFMISDFYGKYYIIMYYDNEYNRANGEDL